MTSASHLKKMRVVAPSTARLLDGRSRVLPLFWWVRLHGRLLAVRRSGGSGRITAVCGSDTFV